MVAKRAEDIELSSEPTSVHRDNPGTVSLARFMGATKRQAIDLGGEQVVLDGPSSGASARFDVGDRVYIDIAPERCYVLPAEPPA